MPWPKMGRHKPCIAARILQDLLVISFFIPALASMEQGTTFAKSNKSFFDLKQTTAKVGHRTKRSTDFTSSEIDTMLARHNHHRSNVNPGASDMIYMEWDDDLASMAQEWSDRCLWEHGNPSNISPFANVGQNLYMVGGVSSSYSLNPEAPVDAWYNEVNYYNYDDNSCSSVCGHYTQVVWSASYAVGCGKTFCSSVTSSSFTNAIIVTCNYGPAGNYAGTKPYLLGSPCTQCSSGIGQCYEDQCRLCSEHSEACECKAVCENCGTKNNDCTCTCQDGWYGSDCSTACEDTHQYCGANPGWYDSSTCSMGDYVPKNCPLMCGVCNAADPSFVCEEESEVSSSDDDDDDNDGDNGSSTTPSATTDSSGDEGDGGGSDISCDPVLTCQNGGTFSTKSCECDCTENYQGDLCQHSKEQARYGVRVLIFGDIRRFPIIEDLLHEIVAYILNLYCNDNFNQCCPGKGTKSSDETLTFTIASDIETAEGYPVQAQTYYWIMLTVRPQVGNDLCADGTINNRRRRNSLLSRRLPRNADDAGNYLSQDALMNAIEENIDEIESSLNVTVGDVQRGVVETQNTSSGTPGWAVAIAIIFTLLAVAVVAIAVAYFLLKKFKPHLLTRWSNTVKRSTSRVGIVTEDAERHNDAGINLAQSSVIKTDELTTAPTTNVVNDETTNSKVKTRKTNKKKKTRSTHNKRKNGTKALKSLPKV